jgi:hydroxyacyl-ACP dehydratase HTD2-like protein with hotdog domain
MIKQPTHLFRLHYDTKYASNDVNGYQMMHTICRGACTLLQSLRRLQRVNARPLVGCNLRLLGPHPLIAPAAIQWRLTAV